MFNAERLQESFHSFIKCGVIFSLASILVVLLASPVFADKNLRPFLDDAGLFDPAKGPINIRFQLFKDTSQIEIRVRDFRGQIVSNHFLVELRAGDHNFSWEGRGAEGEQLPDGRYALLFRAEFTDGSESTAVVDVRIATISVQKQAVPELLPPKEYPHKIQGSLSTFWRHNGSRIKEKDSGEVRLLTDFTFKEKNTRAKGVLSVLQPFYSGSTSFNGSRALLEQDWENIKIKGVFREGLGNFDDPMKLFSDFQSERKKAGVHLNYTSGAIDTRCLCFGSEGDVDSKEQGAAARIKLGKKSLWHLGGSYTYREAFEAVANGNRRRSHAMGVDTRLYMTEELAFVAETVHTSDSEKKEDDGYVASIQYGAGGLTFSGGYIDLGEEFEAPFADPLHHINSDARGMDTRLDYVRPESIGFFKNPAITMGFFDLNRHSDDQKVREMDASLRFGIGERDTFYISWFGQEEGSTHNQTFRGNAERKWDKWWTSRLQVNHSISNFTQTWRLTLDTDWKREIDSVRIAAEWIQREMDTSLLSPFTEANMRLDWNRQLWGIQVQAKQSENRTESGQNFFGRIEYRPLFYHRYRFITYLSIGNRAAFAFEEQVEIGMEVRY